MAPGVGEGVPVSISVMRHAAIPPHRSAQRACIGPLRRGARLARYAPLLSVAGSLCLISGAAGAQASPAFDPLALPPQSVLGCINIPSQPSDTSGIAFTVAMSHGVPLEYVREIVAGYDSAGTPLLLRVALELKTPEDTSHMIAVLFGPDSIIYSGRALATNMVEDGPGSITNPETEPRLLTPFSELSAEEGMRARVLAEWVWTKRCGGKRQGNADLALP